jgi:hypothetical protein
MMESKMKKCKRYLFRWWSVLIPGLVLLLLLPCFLLQTVEADSPWGGGGVDPSITNTDISISGDMSYLWNLVYPLNTSNNFMQATGGGETYTIRYTRESNTYMFGLFGGNYTPGNWTLAGPLQMNAVDTGSSIRVAASVTLPAQGKYFTLNYLIKNTSNSPLTDVKFFEFVEPNANSQDQETTACDASRNLFYSTNNQGLQKYMGVFSTDAIHKHDIGDNNTLSRILLDNLNNSNGPYTGNSWFALEKDLGNLNPGEEKQFRVFFLAGDSLEDMQSLVDKISAPKVPGSSNASIAIMLLGMALLIGLTLLWRERRFRVAGFENQPVNRDKGGKNG